MANGQNPREQVRFYLAHDIAQLPIGTRFLHNPPHVTQTPPAFVDKARMPEVEAFLQEFAETVDTIALRSMGFMFVGHRSEPVPATRFERTPELDFFHRELVHGLGRSGCEFVSLEYALDGYKPHSEAILLDEGAELPMKNITVHTKRPHPQISGLTEITNRYTLASAK